MIDRITLQNFQGHAKTDLELIHGINVIHGPSHSGKSSILRALRWIIENRPIGAGENFRHNDADDKAEVLATIVLNDGAHTAALTRFRKGANNGYRIDDQELKAIRSDVPQEVFDLLWLADHNLQLSQHNSIFLLNDSPGDVARKLNEVCGLQIIDDALGAGATLTNSLKQQQKTAIARAKELEADRERFADLDNREVDLSQVEDLTERRGTLQGDHTELKADIEHLILVDDNLVGDTEFLEGVVPVYETLVGKADQLHIIREQVGDLQSLVEQIERIDSEAMGYNEVIGFADEVDRLLALVKERQQISDVIDDLNQLIDKGMRLDKEVIAMEASIIKREDRFHKEMDAEGACPLCGRTMG